MRLRFRQCGVEGQARRFHARQDVVAGAVEDAGDGRQPVASDSFAQAADDRDAAADGGLEQEIDASLGGTVEQRAPVCRDQLLVGGDDRPAGIERRFMPRARRLQPANDLDDDVHVGVEDILDALGPDDRRRNPVDTLPGDVTIEDVRQRQQAVATFHDQARHRLAHGAEPEQSHRQCHHPGFYMRCGYAHGWMDGV